MKRRSFLGFLAAITGATVIRKYTAIPCSKHLGTAGAPVRNGGISWIPLSELWVDQSMIVHGQAHSNNVYLLANSIHNYGLYESLIVTSKNQVVHGIQRWRALKLLDLAPGTLIPCMIRDFYDHQIEDVRMCESFKSEAMWREWRAHDRVS